MKSLLFMLALAISGALTGTLHGADNLPSDRQIDFNFGWKFFLEDGNDLGRETPFDDGDWRDVRLPHDWSVEASFDSELEGATGYLPGGIGWYQKHFPTPDGSDEKRVLILFDGVYNNAEFWLNGKRIGENPYGYSPVHFDLTEHLARDLEAAAIDVAIMQVDTEHLLATDTVLWSDELRWVTCCECPPDPDQPLPLITFGEHCFYRKLSEPLLVEADIDHAVAFSASSISGVRAAVGAGLGVGVLGSRYLDRDIVAWSPGDDLPALPMIHQIVRTVPGEAPDVAAALVDAIAAELLDPLHAPV